MVKVYMRDRDVLHLSTWFLDFWNYYCLSSSSNSIHAFGFWERRTEKKSLNKYFLLYKYEFVSVNYND